MFRALFNLFVVTGPVYTYKFVACKTVRREGRILDTAYAFAKFSKDFVTCLVAISVVNLLETVYVKNEKGA